MSQLRCALNMHQKSAIYWTSSMDLFYVLVLMLLIKFVPNRTCRHQFAYYAKFAPILLIKLMKLRYHKGAGTKMHNFLVGEVYPIKNHK